MIKVAVVGSGSMGLCHAEAYKNCGAEIVAIVNRNSDKTRALADRCGAAALSSLSELTPGSVDIVDICLPNHLHKDSIINALKICPNILCEKPLCINPLELDEIEKAVSEAGANLMVAQVVRFSDSFLAVAEEIKAPPLSIICKRRQKKPQWTAGNWLFDDEKSGGIIYELAIHDIDFIVNRYGLPKNIAASKNPLNSVVSLTYDDFAATIFSSWAMPDTYNEGKMETYFEVLTENRLVVYDNKQSGDSLFIYEENSSFEKKFTLFNAYEKEISYFLNCVEKNERPEKSDLQSVKNTMLVLQKCKELASKI